jgi:hypothetical protein
MKRLALAALMAAAVLAIVPRPSAEAATCHPGLKALALSARSVPGGAPVAATVTLTCAAPATTTVRLTGFRGVKVPATVRVARHHSSARAVIRTSVTRAVRRGKVEAALGRARRRAALTVTVTPRSCRRPDITALSVPRLAYAGDRPTATIRLNCAPEAPLRIRLTSSSPYLTHPATVTIGRYYVTATARLDARADLAGQYRAAITARFGSRSKTGVITVDPGLADAEIPPASFAPDLVTFSVAFTGEVPAGGLTVRLASDSRAVTLPASYTFTQAGSLGGDIPGISVQPVTANTRVRLSATLGGRTLSATITLLPPFGSGDAMTLSSENGPGDIYGQESDLEYLAILSNPAPAAGVTVTFSSPNPSVEVQFATFGVISGSTLAAVDIDTANVTSAVHTTLVATADGVTATLPLVIEPGLNSFTGVPATITGGDSFTATVNLAGPVDTATTVSLAPLSGVSLPLQVVVPAGQSSASFTVTTFQVSTASTAGFYAMLGTTDLYSSTVNVTPP